MAQKFKRGNLVHIAADLGPFKKHFEKDQDVIIQYSYAERYGGENKQSYSVLFTNTGNSVSWYRDEELTLVEEGGEHLIEQALKKREELHKQHTDIKYILSVIEDHNLSSASILFLFDLIGFQSSFSRNGEFYILYHDWAIFRQAFLAIKNAKTVSEAEAFFSDEGKLKYKIQETFNAFHS